MWKKKIDKSPGLLPFSCLWRLQHPVIHYRWPTSQVALQRRPHHWSDWLKFLLTKLCTNGERVKTCEAPGKRTTFSFIYKRVRGKKSADKYSESLKINCHQYSGTCLPVVLQELCLVVWFLNVLFNNKAIAGIGPKTYVMTILRAATHETVGTP